MQIKISPKRQRNVPSRINLRLMTQVKLRDISVSNLLIIKRKINYEPKYF